MLQDEKKRSFPRFPAKDNTVVFLSFTNSKYDFSSDIFGLVFEEGERGCGVVLINNLRISSGDYLYVQHGDYGPIRSEVVWVKELDSNTTKIGVKYLDMPEKD